jgi:hypothetical protein
MTYTLAFLAIIVIKTKKSLSLHTVYGRPNTHISTNNVSAQIMYVNFSYSRCGKNWPVTIKIGRIIGS